MNLIDKTFFMENSQVFLEAQETVQEISESLLSLFNTLPENTEISVQLDERITCSLFAQGSTVHLEMRNAKNPDVEITFFPESIRRLRETQPSHLTPLATELLRLWLSGMIKYRVLSSMPDLYAKGYLKSLAKVAPELQKEAAKHASTFVSTASMAIQVAKMTLADLRTKYTGKSSTQSDATSDEKGNKN
jgi:hypothetical protein